MDLLADLEGGSGGGGGGVGAVPFLMVGTKEDIGEGVRRDGARLAAELGVRHVAVVSSHLGGVISSVGVRLSSSCNRWYVASVIFIVRSWIPCGRNDGVVVRVLLIRNSQLHSGAEVISPHDLALARAWFSFACRC